MKTSARVIILTASIVLQLPTADCGETLYNGIRLPDSWPPRPAAFARHEAVVPPYLREPPEVIPIDIGRQLFVDDFLISETNLKREFHQPQWHPQTPVLKPEKPWEIRNHTPFAAPFSDGVWWDPQDQQIKMWYMGGSQCFICLATSTDGVRWERPELDEFDKGTNILKVEPIQRDSSTIWLDLEETDLARRFKMVYFRSGLQTRFSRDGIRWSDVVVEQKDTGDRTTVFYNPFRKVWVYSIRAGNRGIGRCRYYCEHRDLGIKAWNSGNELSRWACADDLDRIPNQAYDGDLPDLYNLDATPYESLIVGFFVIHSRVAGGNRPKINQVTLGYSRDGFHWSRPDRRPFLPVSDDPTAWNYGNVQPAGGGFLVMGDKLYFYCSGRNSHKDQDDGTGGSTGLATLRRDGFASMYAAETAGQLTTRPLQFRGKHLFVNADVPEGELTAEIVDANGKPIAPFTRENCQVVRGDSTARQIVWRGADDISKLSGQAVQFRLLLTKGRLYSFWVSPDEYGSSQGYVAAGGPRFTSNRDIVGLPGK